MTVSVQEGGFIQFPIIVYKEAGEHTYTIEEVDPNDDTIDYDMHKETVKVHVEDSGSGDLTAIVEKDADGLVFANRTRPGNLRITKTGLNTSDANKDDTFTFKITLNNQKGLPLGKDDEIYWYTVDANGNVVKNAEPASNQETPAETNHISDHVRTLKIGRAHV